MGIDLRIDQLVAYSGDDQPDEGLFAGAPGVIIDLGPLGDEPAVSFAYAPTICLPASDLVPIDADTYRARAARMKANVHPTSHRSIELFPASDPLDPASAAMSPLSARRQIR